MNENKRLPYYTSFSRHQIFAIFLYGDILIATLSYFYLAIMWRNLVRLTNDMTLKDLKGNQVPAGSTNNQLRKKKRIFSFSVQF